MNLLKTLSIRQELDEQSPNSTNPFPETSAGTSANSIISTTFQQMISVA